METHPHAVTLLQSCYDNTLRFNTLPPPLTLSPPRPANGSGKNLTSPFAGGEAAAILTNQVHSPNASPILYFAAKKSRPSPPHRVWLTRSFARAAHSPERLNKNAPLAIVAEPPSFCRSFMTNTWLGVLAEGFAPLVPPTLLPSPSAAAGRPKSGRVTAEAEAETPPWVFADESRMARFRRSLRGTGSRGCGDRDLLHPEVKAEGGWTQTKRAFGIISGRTRSAACLPAYVCAFGTGVCTLVVAYLQEIKMFAEGRQAERVYMSICIWRDRKRSTNTSKEDSDGGCTT